MKKSVAKRRITDYCRKCLNDFSYDKSIPDNFDSGYVVGVILGDGSIAKQDRKDGFFNYAIILRVTSEKFADEFRQRLNSVTGKKPWSTTYTSTKKANPKIGMPETTVTEHFVGLTNRPWYEKLFPIKKEGKFRTLLKMSQDFKQGFILGMLDSDGYMASRVGYVDFSNKNKKLLLLIQKYLHEFGLSSTITGPYSYSRGVMHLRVRSWPFRTKIA